MSLQLLIINSGVYGHHISLYGRSIVREAIGRGWVVRYLTSVEAADHPVLQEIRDEAGSSFEPIYFPFPRKEALPSAIALLYWQLATWKAYRVAFRGVSKLGDPDHVLVGNLERLEKAIAICGTPFADVQFSGIHLSVRFHYAQLQISDLPVKLRLLQSRLFYRLLSNRKFAGLFTVDSSLPEVARSHSQRSGRKVIYVPDCAAELPSIDRGSARRLLGIPSEAKVILVFGAISGRKSIRELLAAVADPSAPVEAVVVLMGMHNAATRSLLSEPLARSLHEQNRLFSFDRFASARDEAAAYAIADFAWCVYKAFDLSSGVVIQAARNRIPAIVGPRGLIARYIRESRVGYIIDDSCQEIITLGLREIIAGSRSPLASEDFEKFAADHSAQNFALRICDAIENAEPGQSAVVQDGARNLQ